MPRRKNPIKSGQEPVSVKNQSCKKLKNLESLKASYKSTTSSTENRKTAISTKEKLAFDESTKLLTVFPDEVWLIIFVKLKNTEDVATISNSSLFFRNMLLPQRVTFLFPQVWQVLGMKYERSSHPVYEEDKESATLKKSRLDSGNSRKICGYSVILKLREVCRTWCNGVDEFCRNLDTNYIMNQDAYHPLKNDCKWELHPCKWVFHKQNGCWSKNYDFELTERLNEFRTHFEQSHQGHIRSPFISKEVLIEAKANDEYTSHLMSFLEDWSEHIWHCNIDVESQGISLSEVYLKIRSLLQFLPNLLGLNITYLVDDGDDDEEMNPMGMNRSGFVEIENRELRQLKRDIFRNPLPTLPKLRYLKTENLPAAIFDQLLSQNAHIQMLEFERKTPENYNVFSAEMSNLVQLSADIQSKSEFQTLDDSSWKLTKVYLDFEYCAFIPWSQVFQLVEKKWGQTATEVMLGLPVSKTSTEVKQHMDEHDSLRLSLPKAKRLRIELGNPSSMDFILPMKESLKQLEIAKAYISDFDYKSGIKKLWKSTGFEKIIMHSKFLRYVDGKYGMDANIWEVFPKLDVTKYSEGRLKQISYPDIITRAEWLRYKESESDVQ